MTARWFEDYVRGAVRELAHIKVGEEERRAFAERFDPLPIHTDRTVAEKEVQDGLIGSGCYNSCLMMQLFLSHYFLPDSAAALPGIERLQWAAPARQTDVHALRVWFPAISFSLNKRDRGAVVCLIEMHNQCNEVVLT